MHPKWDVRHALTISLVVFGSALASAQKGTGSKLAAHPVPQNVSQDRHATNEHPLSEDARLSLIAAALDSRLRDAEPDCSHLVHAIYEQAGLTYAYAPSSELYTGIDAFARVKKPESGDLVVWRGHVGIVIKPSQHLFFSVLTSGPGIDDYTTRYWKHRGKPRFYRYAKTAVTPQRSSPQLVRTNRVRNPNSGSDDD